MGILRSEMKWTTQCFDHQKIVRQERAVKKGATGDEAYAFRQAAMWEEFENESRRILGKYM